MPPGPAAREALQVICRPCALGWLLLAASHQGVRFLLLGDDEARLRHDLQQRAPGLQVHPADARTRQWVEQVIEQLPRIRPDKAPPLDLRGTAFQQQVWQSLREIPPGTTRSYGQQARLVGHPGSARALARACAGNPLALLVPCHRIIRQDGQPGGYRWGDWRKQWLLDQESRPCS